MSIQSATGLAGFLALGVLLSIRLAGNDSRLRSLLLAFTAVVSVALLANAAYGPFIGYTGDWTGDRGYIGLDAHARQIAEDGLSHFLENIQVGRQLYAWLVAPLYMLFGPEPLLAAALNIPLGVATLASAYALAHELGGGRRAARTAALFTGITPTVIIYSFIPVRDPLLVVLSSLGILSFLKWRRSGSTAHLAGSFVSLAVAGAVHSGLAVILAVVVTFALVRSFPLVRSGQPVGIGSRLVIVGGFLMMIYGSGILLQKIGGAWDALVTIQGIEAVTLKDDSDQRTAYVSREEARVGSIGGALLALPKRIVLFLLTPFPWQVRAVEDLVGLIVAVEVAVAGAFIGLRVRTVLSRPDYRTIGVVLAAFVVVFAWGTVNYGSATRHKTKAVPLVAALCAVLRRRSPGHSPAITVAGDSMRGVG